MGGFFDPFVKIFKPDPNEIGQAGYTRLQYAIADNNIDKARSLIAHGADLNLRGTYKYPPLHMALQRNRYSIALALIKAGADVNLLDVAGQTPLHIAAEQNHETFTIALLKSGADPNIKNKAGKTPLHLVSPYSVQLVDALAKNKADLNAQDAEGNTPLHRFLNYPEMVERLLSLGADPNIRNLKGQSAFMMMLDDKHLPVYSKPLQRVLALKADLASTNPLGETLLHLTARMEMEEAFLTAVGNADLSTKDANGNNVLHAMAGTQNVRMIRQVLARAPSLVGQTNKRGLTPLEELLRRVNPPDAKQQNVKWVEAVAALLESKANPDSADDRSRTVLHHAVIYDRMNILEAALDKGADPNLADIDGKTALHYAIERNNLRAMDTLLDRGANPDMTDARGWTILDRLAEKNDRDSPIVQRLIVAGGQYQKQLPLYPDQMRRPKVIDKGRPGLDKPAGPKPGPRL